MKAYGGGGSGGGGGVFRVTLTPTDVENQYSADKTFSEIIAAYKGGMEVEAVTVESVGALEFISIYQLTVINCVENIIDFTSVESMMGSWYIYKVTMRADGVVTIAEKKVS